MLINQSPEKKKSPKKKKKHNRHTRHQVQFLPFRPSKSQKDLNFRIRFVLGVLLFFFFLSVIGELREDDKNPKKVLAFVTNYGWELDGGLSLKILG